MFTKLKEITEHALKIKVNDCVISVSLPFHLLKVELNTLPDISNNYNNYLLQAGSRIF